MTREEVLEQIGIVKEMAANTFIEHDPDKARSYIKQLQQLDRLLSEL